MFGIVLVLYSNLTPRILERTTDVEIFTLVSSRWNMLGGDKFRCILPKEVKPMTKNKHLSSA